jgi:NADPH-dependent ferric siderophore reductase
LSDSEATNGYALMCRALPSTDLVVELLHHDGEALALEHPPRDGEATVTSLEQLTPEVTRLVLDSTSTSRAPSGPSASRTSRVSHSSC